MELQPAKALKRRTVRAVTNFEWTLIEKYIATHWPDVAGCPTGVAGAILAQDLVESLVHLRICCRGNRPKGESSQTLAKLIQRFNAAQFALFEVLHKHGARGVLHDVNGPTGVRYAANQEPVGSYSEAVWVTGQVFYLHCLGETDSEAYQAGVDRSGPGPRLDKEACVAKWNRIAPCGYEILEPVAVLQLATEREVVKAYGQFKAVTASPAGAGHLNHPSLQKRHGADNRGGQMAAPSKATEPTGDDIVKRLETLERRSKEQPKRLTKVEKIRKQRNDFSCKRRTKNPPEGWRKIYVAYNKKFPSDKSASSDTLRLSHDRNCQKCRTK